MSREIKFRVWYPGDKSMHVISFADLAELGNWCLLHDYDDFEKHPERLMQFIGLCDINGKEIYEGDIDKDGFVFVYDTQMGGMYRKNDRHGYGWHVQATTHGGTRLPFEIIGNIYENPELLEVRP